MMRRQTRRANRLTSQSRDSQNGDLETMYCCFGTAPSPGHDRSALLTTLIACVLTGAATGVAAQEEEENGLGGTAKLGYAATTGNAESSNLTASLDLKLLQDDWRHRFTATAFRATAQDNATGDVDTTAERYQLGYQVNWDLSERSYVFGRINYDRDLFSGFSRQLSETVGYGNRLVQLEHHLLEGEVGVGAKQAKRNDGSTLDQAIGRATLTYTWAFSDTGSFNQVFNVETGPDNTQTEAISELKATLIGNIAMSLSYIVRNNSNVPADSASTDTFTTVALSYDF